MTWVKLDDKFYQHPKVMGISDKAFRCHINALCFSAQYDLDGEIPVSALSTIRGTVKLATELVTALLWDTTSRGGWAIHDYLDYNRSKADIEADRERKRTAGQAGGFASGEARAKQGASPTVRKRRTPVPVPSGSKEPDPSGAVALPPPKSQKVPTRPFTVEAEAELRQRLGSQHPDFDLGVRKAMRSTGYQFTPDKYGHVEDWLLKDIRERNGNGNGSNVTRRDSFPQLTRAADAKGPGRTPDLVG